MKELDLSDQLVMNYLAYKNGGRDLSKLTKQEAFTSFILESEMLITAVCLLYQLINSKEEFNLATSSLKIIETLDLSQLAHMCEIYVESRGNDANSAIEKLQQSK